MLTTFSIPSGVRMHSGCIASEIAGRALFAFGQYIKSLGLNVGNHPYSAFITTGVLPLSSIVPIYLSEGFQYKNVDVVETMVFATLCLDCAAQHLDDVTDKGREVSPASLHLSHILVSKATAFLVSAAENPNTVALQLDKIIQEVLSAERYLWKNKNVNQPYVDEDFNVLGKRGGLISVCLPGYCDATDKWDLFVPFSAGLQSCAAGIQLCDDLLDWRDDFERGIMTHPIALACRKCAVRGSPTEYEVAEQLAFHGVAIETVKRAQSLLTQGRLHFAGSKMTSLIALIDEIMRASDAFLDHLRIFEINPVNTRELPDILERYWRKYTDVRMQH